MFKAYNRRTKRCLLCEEYISLTKDIKAALLLNQCVYWMERTHDYDLFLKEEYEHNPQCNVSYRHGWFYKSYEAFNDECMLKSSKSTISRILNSFIEKGWLERRHRKSTTLDQTYEYRVNLTKLQSDLLSLGYTIANYKIDLLLSKPAKQDGRITIVDPKIVGNTDLIDSEQPSSPLEEESPMFQNETSMLQDETCKLQAETSLKHTFIETNDFSHKSSMFQNGTSMLQNRTSKFQNETSTIQQNTAENKDFSHTIPMFQNETSMLQDETCKFQNETPYIDTKITKREINNKTLSLISLPKSSKNTPLDVSKKEREEVGFKMIKMFSRIVSQGQELLPHPERINRLKHILHSQLQEKLENWERVCQNITRSKFLMGEAQTSDFKATLDWVMTKDHAIKIFEGNIYGIGDRIDLNTGVSISEEAQEALLLEFKNSNKHPLWIEAGLILEQTLGFYTFKSYILDLDLLKIERDHIKLSSKDSFVGAWVKKNLESSIKQILSKILGRQIEFLTIVTESHLEKTVENRIKAESHTPISEVVSNAIDDEKREAKQMISCPKQDIGTLVFQASQIQEESSISPFDISKGTFSPLQNPNFESTAPNKIPKQSNKIPLKPPDVEDA